MLFTDVAYLLLHLRESNDRFCLCRMTVEKMWLLV